MWGVQVVTADWLLRCARRGYREGTEKNYHPAFPAPAVALPLSAESGPPALFSPSRAPFLDENIPGRGLTRSTSATCRAVGQPRRSAVESVGKGPPTASGKKEAKKEGGAKDFSRSGASAGSVVTCGENVELTVPARTLTVAVSDGDPRVAHELSTTEQSSFRAESNDDVPREGQEGKEARGGSSASLLGANAAAMETIRAITVVSSTGTTKAFSGTDTTLQSSTGAGAGPGTPSATSTPFDQLLTPAVGAMDQNTPLPSCSVTPATSDSTNREKKTVCSHIKGTCKHPLVGSSGLLGENDTATAGASPTAVTAKAAADEETPAPERSGLEQQLRCMLSAAAAGHASNGSCSGGGGVGIQAPAARRRLRLHGWGGARAAAKPVPGCGFLGSPEAGTLLGQSEAPMVLPMVAATTGTATAPLLTSTHGLNGTCSPKRSRRGTEAVVMSASPSASIYLPDGGYPVDSLVRGGISSAASAGFARSGNSAADATANADVESHDNFSPWPKARQLKQEPLPPPAAVLMDNRESDYGEVENGGERIVVLEEGDDCMRASASPRRPSTLSGVPLTGVGDEETEKVEGGRGTTRGETLFPGDRGNARVLSRTSCGLERVEDCTKGKKNREEGEGRGDGAFIGLRNGACSRNHRSGGVRGGAWKPSAMDEGVLLEGQENQLLREGPEIVSE